jgi:hypothetical protein
MDRKSLRGYLNPARLGQINPLDLLTPDGEHEQIPLTASAPFISSANLTATSNPNASPS